MRAIIIYYSRSGKTEKAAIAVDKALSSAGIYSELEKIKPLKTKGYFKNALMAVFRRETPILNVNFDVSMYDFIIIGSPVWAGSMATPLNSYLEDIEGISGKKVASFVTMAVFGGSRALRQISRMVGSKGGKCLTGIELEKQEIMDDKVLEGKIKNFIKSTIK